MSKRLVRNADSIKQLSKCRHKKRRNKYLAESNDDLIRCLVECVYNVLKGTVPLNQKQKKALKRHTTALRDLSKIRQTTKARHILQQKGGFLPAILLPIVAAAAGGILSEVIGKIIRGNK